MLFQKVNRFYSRHKEEFILGCSLIIVSVIIQPIIDQQGFNSRDKFFIMLRIVIIFLFLLNLFNIRKLFNKRFKEINRRIFDEFCLFASEDKYFKRLNHWPVEKKKIAKFCARKVLPDIINNVFKENPKLERLNIILDSGTTITPIFKYIIDYDYLYKDHKDNLVIYTNNLSGISEIYKHDLLEDSLFSDSDFNLLGGQPLNKYRATTGPQTLESVWRIKKMQNKKNGDKPVESGYKELTIGIITANWFLINSDYSTISLCASGRGHYEFKKELIDNCDHIILISPLGKLLPLNDVTFLNNLVSIDPKDHYNSILISNKNKNKTHLVTTYRPARSLSPLLSHSNNLESNKTTYNYLKWEGNKPFKPIGKKTEVENTELPHGYIREKFEKVFHYNLN